MKVGTLLKSLDYDDIGVVTKITKHKVFVYWTRNDFEEAMYKMDINKWIIGGFIQVLESNGD